LTSNKYTIYENVSHEKSDDTEGPFGRAPDSLRNISVPDSPEKRFRW